MNYLTAPLFLFLSISSVALFSFVAVAAWADARRKEREAYYKSETLKKIAESQGPGPAAVLELLHEEEKKRARRVREGLKLGGLITAVVGISVTAFLAVIMDKGNKGFSLAGLIPFLTGVALFVYANFLAPKE